MVRDLTVNGIVEILERVWSGDEAVVSVADTHYLRVFSDMVEGAVGFSYCVETVAAGNVYDDGNAELQSEGFATRYNEALLLGATAFGAVRNREETIRACPPR